MSKHPPLVPMTTPYLASTPHSPERTFNRPRHITYWLRCARTFLPEAYTSSDSSRMLFAFFTVSALDLLGLLDGEPTNGGNTKNVTSEERWGWIEWIYHCQKDEGGFRGFTGAEGSWDPANLPATFFALCSLLILGDDLGRVRRRECLEWMKRMQRGDGSFGEVLDEGGKIEGGRDLRFCCCAAGVRRFLMGSGKGGEEDFDADGMVRYIESSQSYEGGFAEGPFAEPHSGLNYCAVAALSFLGRIPGDIRMPVEGTKIDLMECTKWVLQRQTTYIEEEENEEDSDDDDGTDQAKESEQSQEKSPIDGSLLDADLRYTGFNGRTNKVADTCYAFWNMGAVAILDQTTLIDNTSLRRYLLGKVQHMVGGFGKGVNLPPDILHAYLGLATLSMLGEEGIKPIEPTLCMSRDAAARIDKLAWREERG